MQEINRAWAVLRNPALRAAYDETLAPPAVITPPSARVRLTPPDQLDGLAAPRPLSEREPADERDDTGSGCAIALVVLGVAIAGTVVVAVIAAMLTANTEPSSVEVRTQERFAVGTCVLIAPAPADGSGSGSDPVGGTGSATAVGALGANGPVTIEDVPCTGTGPRSGKVVAKVKVPLPCPSNSAAVVLITEDRSLCVARS